MPEDSQSLTEVYSPEIEALWQLPRAVISLSPNIRSDLFILFVVPISVLTGIFVSTEAVTFEYRMIDPTLLGIFGSNLSHRSWNHLGNNVSGLILIGVLEYIILTASGYRIHYWFVFLGTLVVLPIFGHLFLQFFLIQQPVFQTYEAVGFSEPLAALAGYLPLALTTYQSKASGLRWPILWALLLYAGGIAWAMSQIFGVSRSTYVIGALGIIGIFGVYYLSMKQYQEERVEKPAQYLLTITFILLIYGHSLIGLFGGQNVGSMVGHLAGFIPGFFVPMVLIWIFSMVRPYHEWAIKLE